MLLLHYATYKTYYICYVLICVCCNTTESNMCVIMILHYLLSTAINSIEIKLKLFMSVSLLYLHLSLSLLHF